jgi:rubrerythrin
MFEIGEIVEIAVQLEKNGAKTYRHASQCVSDESVAGVLGELAEDETRHAGWFGQLGDRLRATKAVDSALEDMGKELLKNMVKEQAFSLQEADFTSVDKLEDVLTTAVAFEEDTILFYQMLGSFIGDERTIQHLEDIIEEEKKHIRILRERLEALGDLS